MRLLCKQAQIDTQNMYLFSSLLEIFNRLKERILAKKKRQWETERVQSESQAQGERPG